MPLTMKLPEGPYDLSNCELEPVHIPGSIQPHGVLLGLLEPSLALRVASQTASGVFGFEMGVLLESTLFELFDTASLQRVQSVLSLPHPESRNPLPLRTKGAVDLDGIVHRSDGLAILELEPANHQSDQTRPEWANSLRVSIARLQNASDVEEAANLAAILARDLTGYDRSMVYQFDPDGNGKVIGEARRVGLESYLGLNYPAADIPPQARRLYRMNTLRLIADVDYDPSPLVPTTNPLTGRPLDMSRSVLRSVSPFHREYLRNMGVSATLAISLILEGELWGLLVCHHYEPRHVSYELRATCEVLATYVGIRVSELGRRQAAARQSFAEGLAQRLAPVLVGGSLEDVRPTNELDSLCSLFQATTVAIVRDDATTTAGAPVTRETLDVIASWLATLDIDGHFATDALGNVETVNVDERFAGLLALPLTPDRRGWLLVLRPELVTTVNWGASKEKKINIQDGAPRLSPEGSFGLWQETVRGRSAHWTASDIVCARAIVNSLYAEEAKRVLKLENSARELRRVAEAKDEFLAQLSHELRNPLNAILGWSELMLQSTEGLEARVAKGLDVIKRNARLQARLIDDLLDVSRIIRGNVSLQLRPIALETVILGALESVKSAADAKQIIVRKLLDPAAGPVSADAERLQQVVWNLLSNAVKFSPKGSHVEVKTTLSDSSAHIIVEDSGPGIESNLIPHLFERFRQGLAGTGSNTGLGLGLSIVKGLVELHGGQVYADNTERGARFTVQLPIIAARDAQEESLRSSPLMGRVTVEQEVGILRGAKIIVVDDERDAAELVRTALEREGANVRMFTDPAALLADPDLEVDVLLSDIGMPTIDGIKLLRMIRDRGALIPAIALTAYASPMDRLAVLRAGFSMHMAKPVDLGELIVTVASVIGRFR